MKRAAELYLKLPPLRHLVVKPPRMEAFLKALGKPRKKGPQPFENWEPLTFLRRFTLQALRDEDLRPFYSPRPLERGWG